LMKWWGVSLTDSRVRFRGFCCCYCFVLVSWCGMAYCFALGCFGPLRCSKATKPCARARSSPRKANGCSFCWFWSPVCKACLSCERNGAVLVVHLYPCSDPAT
jgi:hypothetical protein